MILHCLVYCLRITVHIEGVAQLLTSIQPHKASGPNNLPARFLKEVANEISPVLTVVFQASLEIKASYRIFGELLLLYLHLKKEIEMSQVIADQYLSPVSAPNF